MCIIKPRSVINVSTTDLSFQDNEIEEHSIDTVDDGHDDVNLEDAFEHDLQAADMEDDEDENMSIDSEQCGFYFNVVNIICF